MRIHIPGNGWLGYDVAGQGRPLVLLHAFPLDHTIWRAQAEALRSDYRILMLDLRGFGESDPFEDSPSIEAMADDVRALLEALKIEGSVVVGGLSMGGYVALAFARRYPDWLQGLILADTRAEADTPEGKAGREATIALAEAQGAGPVIEQMLPKLLGDQTRQRQRDIVDEVRRLGTSQSVAGIVGGLRAMRDRPDAGPWLGRIAVPTLVLVGSEDRITPPSLADSLATHIPGARKTIINGAGHLANMEQPDAFNDAVRGFLRSLPG